MRRRTKKWYCSWCQKLFDAENSFYLTDNRAKPEHFCSEACAESRLEELEELDRGK